MRRILATVGLVALISTGVNASRGQDEPRTDLTRSDEGSATDRPDRVATRTGRADRRGSAAPPTPWPSQLLISGDLREFAELAWNHSATFRDQCRQLGAARAVVIVRSSQETFRAKARIGLSADGVTVAHVSVRRSPLAVELIAHELEHVLERTEGINYLLQTTRPHSGVSRSASGFETRRADDAGRRVAEEVRAATRAHAGSEQ